MSWRFLHNQDIFSSIVPEQGLRANQATKAGYSKATGKDKEVYNTT